jgi:hypothetical protein
MHHQQAPWIILAVLRVVWGGLGGVWAEQPKHGGILRVAFEADVTGFDPAIPGLQNYYVNQNLFNTLVTLDEKLELVPDMAETWEIQEQRMVYLFYLPLWQGTPWRVETPWLSAPAIRSECRSSSLWTSDPPVTRGAESVFGVRLSRSPRRLIPSMPLWHT